MLGDDSGRMELRQLEIFRVLARELNFTRTAERVHCVQSNVTVQIRALEEELGVKLFERLGKQVSLTGEGARLLPYVEQSLELLAQARQAVAEQDEPSGTLSIGTPESVLSYRLPAVLHEFRERFPRVELSFRLLSCGKLYQNLEQGAADLILTIDEEAEYSRLHQETLCAEPMTLIAQLHHPLSKLPAVQAADLRNETLLLTEDDCSYRLKFERVLAQAGITPAGRIEFSSLEAIKQCAALGVGIALLPAMAVGAELAQGKLTALRWKGPELAMQTQMAWHKDKWQSAAMRAFVALLRDHFQSEAASKPVHPLTHQQV
jgi:DNA-binding transcriptional LysR family regulator